MKKNLKKILTSAGCNLISISLSACAYGNENVSPDSTFAACGTKTTDNIFIACALETPFMQVNDVLTETDSVPFLYDSTSYVPIRSITEAFGAEVSYEAETSTVIVVLNEQIQEFKVNDGIIYNDRTYFPIRKLVECFGFNVEWYDGLITISNINQQLSNNVIDETKSKLNFVGYQDRKTAYSVTFSAAAGLYADAFDLYLETGMPNAEIHYTTDGSDPTVNSPLYTDKIYVTDRTMEANTISNIRTADEDFITPYGRIFKGTTIKAKAFDQNGNSSPISVSSYFINKNIFSRYGVKVVSITTPQENLFDSEIGIYTPNNCFNKGSEWERSAYMEVFDTAGNCTVSQTVGLRINGAFTRKYQQKSLRIYARENNNYLNGDSKKVKYDFFDEKVTDNTSVPIDTYKTIILRNSGDDWYNNFIRDAIVEELAEPLRVDTMGYIPSVVFINGEYWGVHEIRERYDDSYFKQHYNLNNTTDVAMVEIGTGGSTAEISEGDDNDLEDFNSKAYFVINNDMTNSEYYEKAGTYFDVDNLIDYYCLSKQLE